MTRPTLVSLAAELGVSRQTVSNVLNAPHLVRESTRSRVQAAIDQSGYRPSAAAQALRTRRSNTLGMRLYPTVDGINGAVLDRFVHCVVEQAELLGHRVVLFTASDDDAEVAALRELIDRNSIDACILTSTTENDARARHLSAAGIPFGAFGRPWGDADSAHLWADIDGAAGTAMATEYLIERGCKRVGFIGWPEPSGVGNDRLAGWQGVMSQQLGFDADELATLVVRTEDDVANGAAGMAHLIDLGCDGVVCASDSLATGALHELRDGLSNQFVPVIGFDDTPVARALGLSSVSQPVEAAATLLVHSVLAKGDDANSLGSDAAQSTPVGVNGHLLTPHLLVRQFEPVELTHPHAG